MQGERGGQTSLIADALIGAAAGATAVWLMDRVDWYNFKHENAHARERTQSVRPGGMDPAHVAANKAADALGQELKPSDNNAAGLAVHYSLGILPGALYGVMRHQVPGLDAGRGTAFGTGLFLIQDEGLNAIAGLSAKPSEYPWQAHARGLLAHVVYGLALDTALQITGRLRDRSRV